MGQAISEFFRTYIPLKIEVTDIVEIIIISFMLYEVLKWVQSTRAWQLLKGIIVILVFIALAAIFKLNTILWIVDKAVNVLMFAIVIVFQPELRKALEQLGSKNLISGIFSFEGNRPSDSAFTEKTISELVRASVELGKAKTGALMVIEREVSLKDIERTGIEIDGLVTSQLLINIFEHNTPLHDGAVVIRGNRVVAATCYLPLSDNTSISKDLGTRHRAAVGVSEVTDSLTIVVSEETGRISLAENGRLTRIVDADTLSRALSRDAASEEQGNRFRIWKGRLKNERKADK